MQTILLQDNPALFRGLEHSLLCREGIDLLTASGASALLETCRRSRAQVVFLEAEAILDNLTRQLESLPHAPLCLRVHDGGEARRLLNRVVERLGVPGRRDPRRTAHLPVKITSPGAAGRGRTRDLSVSGAFVGTRRAEDWEGLVEITFTGGPRDAAIACRGTIVRQVTQSEASHHLPGLAVQFAPDHGLSAGQLDHLILREREVNG